MYCLSVKKHVKQLKGSAVFFGGKEQDMEREKQCDGGAAGEEVVIVLTENPQLSFLSVSKGSHLLF